MPIHVAAEQSFRVGVPTVIKGPAPNGSYLAVLEDDGESAYFYAMDSSKEQPFQDGVLIYTKESAEDKPYVAIIGWSPDSKKAILMINGYPNAVFDFEAKEGCCRTGYPPMLGPGWSPHGHTWRDDMLQLFEGPKEPTPWAGLVDIVTDLCSIDTSIEDHTNALVVETAPATFLDNPGKINELFQAAQQNLPEGAKLNFYNHGNRLVLIASRNEFLLKTIVAQRGYQAR